MDCLIGIAGEGFVLVAADTNAARSIVVMKTDQEKMFQLSKNMVLLSSGESGDSVQFCEYVEKNVKFYEMKNGMSWSISTFFALRCASDCMMRAVFLLTDCVIALFFFDRHSHESTRRCELHPQCDGVVSSFKVALQCKPAHGRLRPDHEGWRALLPGLSGVAQ
eukprot:Opistho-2@47524